MKIQKSFILYSFYHFLNLNTLYIFGNNFKTLHHYNLSNALNTKTFFFSQLKLCKSVSQTDPKLIGPSSFRQRLYNPSPHIPTNGPGPKDRQKIRVH